jgi:hypothetical protein
MKTVREAAEELQVSRQTIYSKLTDKFKQEYTTIKMINGKETLVINNKGLEYLKETVNKVDSKDDSQLDSQINNQLVELLGKNIELLQKQLEVKDEQISELNERLREAQELNKNNQILLHRQQEQPKMLESENKKEKKGFFDFFKKK